MLELRVGSGHPGVGFFQALQFPGLKSWIFFLSGRGFSPSRRAGKQPAPQAPSHLPCSSSPAGQGKPRISCSPAHPRYLLRGTPAPEGC